MAYANVGKKRAKYVSIMMGRGARTVSSTPVSAAAMTLRETYLIFNRPFDACLISARVFLGDEVCASIYAGAGELEASAPLAVLTPHDGEDASSVARKMTRS